MPRRGSGELRAVALQDTKDNTTAVPTREAVFAVIAGLLGWTLDAFDFFLVVIALPSIAKDFGVSEPAIAFSLTLTLMFRPVGAFLFGLLADRYGRRIPMMIDLVFYSVIEVATAFSPNLTIFLILRALFGIGMGGEWGVGASLVMEKVPTRWRGVLSGLLQEGYAAGYLLSAAENWSHLGRTLRAHWKIWLYLTLLMAAMNFASHGTQDMFPTFMKQFRGMDARTYSQVVMLMMTGAIVGGIAFGLASDRLGRRKMIIVAFGGALAVTPLWAFSSGMTAIITGAAIMQFMVQGRGASFLRTSTNCRRTRCVAFCPALPTSAETSLPLRSPACNPHLPSSILILCHGLECRGDISPCHR